jgi:N-acetylglucosaminyl-diphospho-decaprenol L-rhamnosyltransferase
MAAKARGRERLAVIIVSHNDAHWLGACISSVYERAGDLDVEIVVVDSGSSDGTGDLVSRAFPAVRLVTSANRGFAAANNRGLETVEGDWVLFLNPDTEVVEGTLELLISLLRQRPTVGLAAVRHLTPDGAVFPTMRRFPNALRWLFEALGSERAPFQASWLGERELDATRYEHETPCDWTTGAFMLVRRAAIESAGNWDERFFLYCEETDLCLRIHQAGWDIWHFPQLTIVHHANKAGWNESLAAQSAFARRLYMAKHFSAAHRVAGIAALGLGYGLRALARSRDPEVDAGRRACARAALATLAGRRPPPFGNPTSDDNPRADGR